MTPSRPPSLQTVSSGIRDPLLVSIADARTISGLSRSAIYRHMAAGKIHAVKGGSRTLIVLDSLVEYVRSLPRATFRAPR